MYRCCNIGGGSGAKDPPLFSEEGEWVQLYRLKILTHSYRVNVVMERDSVSSYTCYA